MFRSVPDEPEEVVMVLTDKTASGSAVADPPLDPKTLNFIERILYYENLAPIEADNDNKNTPSDSKGSACFDSWAMPDYMRK
jgi:hypothetical protein